MRIVQGDKGVIFPFFALKDKRTHDITGATLKMVLKQGDRLFTKDITNVKNAAIGKCEIEFTELDLALSGLCEYQVIATFPDGDIVQMDKSEFHIEPSLYYSPETPPSEGGGTIGGSVFFEEWLGNETVEIDTGTTTPPDEEEPNPTDTTAPIVTATPNGGTFQTSQNVTLSANETATIYYTLDGSTPTESSSVYSSAINLTDTKTIKFFGKDTAGNKSAVQSVTFTKDVQAPADTTPPTVTITPNGGTFTTSQQVTLSANETADIYYTTDGSTPTTASTKYTAPFTVSATTTVKYFAKDTAGNSSAVQSVTFTKEVTDGTKFLDLSLGQGGILLPTNTTFNKIELEAEIASSQIAGAYIFDMRATSGGIGTGFGYTGGLGGAVSIYSINDVAGTDKTLHYSEIPKGQKNKLVYTFSSAVTTSGGAIFMRSMTNDSFMKGKLYKIKLYNNSALVASFNMTNQTAGTTINDENGNGKVATIHGNSSWGG